MGDSNDFASSFPTLIRGGGMRFHRKLLVPRNSNDQYLLHQWRTAGRKVFLSSAGREYSNELSVAVRAVQMACFLCKKVQQNLIAKSNDLVQSKDDNSPVTVAGCVIYAKKGSGQAWMQPVLNANMMLVWPNSAIQVQVSSIEDPALATFFEPVEKANSSHSFAAGLAHTVGLRCISFTFNNKVCNDQ